MPTYGLISDGLTQYVQGDLVAGITGDFILKTPVRIGVYPQGTAFSNILALTENNTTGDYIGIALDDNGFTGTAVAKIISNGKTPGRGTTKLWVNRTYLLEVRYVQSTNLASFYIDGVFEYSVNPTGGATWIPTLTKYRFFSATTTSSFGSHTIYDGCEIEDTGTPANTLTFNPTSSGGTGTVLTDTSPNANHGTLFNYNVNNSQWVNADSYKGIKKTLDTGHALYGNITRALSAYSNSNTMYDLLGGADTDFQNQNIANSTTVSGTGWTVIQGFCRDASHWYGFDSPFGGSVDALRKWDLTGTPVASNLSPFASMPAGTWRFGDGCVSGGVIYNPVHTVGGATTHLTRYSATDLSFISTTDIDSLNTGNGGCCIGESGNLYIVGWSSTADDELTMRVTEVTTAGSFVAYHYLSNRIIGMQGITWDATNEFYYISSNDVLNNYETIFKVSKDWLVGESYNPTGTSVEAEGVEFYDGKLYYNGIQEAIREVDIRNMYISTDTTFNEPIHFLDNSLMTDNNTVIIKMRNVSNFNFNSIIDNVDSSNNWESWVDASNLVKWRITASTSTSGVTLSAGADHILAYTWARAGTITAKLGVDGVYGTPLNTANTAAPSGGMWLAGKGASNNQGNNVYYDILVFDKVLSDAEYLDAYNNFDSFYASSGGSFTLDVDGGIYSTTGSAVSLLHNRLLSTDGGVYSSTGSALSLLHNRLLGVDGGSYSTTGANISLLHNRALNIDGGSYSYTGSSVDLIYTPIGGYTLDVDGGVFTSSGGEVDLLLNRAMQADGGSYLVTGANVATLYNRAFSIDGGSFSYSGASINLLFNRALQTDGGVYSFSGGNVGLVYSGQITLLIDCYSVQFKQDEFTIDYQQDSVGIDYGCL